MSAWYGEPQAAGCTFEPVPGGVCAPSGVRAAGVHAGLKPSGRDDLALVDVGSAADAAAVQTTNQVKAAPVVVTERHIADGKARAVLLNSGSANACTGGDGEQLAAATAASTAELLGCAVSEVLVCSTGVIGVLPSRGAIDRGIPLAVEALSATGSRAAAEAIMTTDTVPKEAALRVSDADGSCVIGGIAKGAGMLAPELATMLCVVTTDAPVSSHVLAPLLRKASAQTFGRVSVDGCRSTNDAVIALAPGGAPRPPSLAAFADGLTAVLGDLAEQMVQDGEGVKHLVRLHVRGAAEEHQALMLARAIADSVLVRTAIAGGDPNWGRILAAMGASDVLFDPERVEVRFGSITVCRFGVATSYDAGQAAAALKGPDVDVTVDLRLGGAHATMLTCDLTHDYVTINAEYTT